LTAKCVDAPGLHSGQYAPTCSSYYATVCKILYSISN